MGSKTKTVGGGNAAPVANGFQDFLMGQLNPNGMNATQTNQQAKIDQLQGLQLPFGGNSAQLMAQRMASQGMGQAGVPQNQMQQPSPWQSLIQAMGQGQIQDQSGSGQALNGMIQNGPQNLYQNPSLNQLPTGYGGSGMADLSGVQNNAVNTTQGMGSVGSSGLDQIFRQMLQQSQGFGGQVNAQGVSLAPATQFDMNNPYFSAIKDQSQMTSDRNAAELRARFGAQGAGSIGTGAQYAESNLRATEAPQLTIALQQALQGLQQQDLAERGTQANIALGSAGQNLQGQLGNQNAGLNNGSNMLQALLSGRGQDINAMTAGRGQDIGLRNQDINALLSNQSQGNSFQQQNNQQNSQNMQSNNANAINQSQLSAQFGAQGMSDFLQALGLGQQQNQTGANMQQNLLNQLFGSFGQSSGLGTPQPQTVQQPSTLGQIAGAGLGILGSGIFSGFGGGQAPQSTPLYRAPTYPGSSAGAQLNPLILPSFR